MVNNTDCFSEIQKTCRIVKPFVLFVFLHKKIDHYLSTFSTTYLKSIRTRLQYTIVYKAFAVHLQVSFKYFKRASTRLGTVLFVCLDM